MFFGSFEVRILSGFWLGWSDICDVLIAAALSYYLHSKKTGFKRCDRNFFAACRSNLTPYITGQTL